LYIFKLISIEKKSKWEINAHNVLAMIQLEKSVQNNKFLQVNKMEMVTEMVARLIMVHLLKVKEIAKDRVNRT